MTVVTISDTRAQPTEHDAVVMVWERCVLATHDFLTEADIVLFPCCGMEIMRLEAAR